MASTPIAERIALLLRKAESTDSPAEAEALTEAAEKLMLKHGIERAMLQSTDKKSEEIIVGVTTTTGIYAWEQYRAAQVIATAFGLKSFYGDYRKFDRSIHVSIVGFESDVNDAMAVIKSLELQGLRAMKAWNKTRPGKQYETPMESYKARRAFVQYFGQGAAHRIEENRGKAVKEAGSGAELVLVDRTKLVEQYMDDTFKLQTVKNRRAGSLTGQGAGFAAGKEAMTGERGLGYGQAAIGR